MNMTLLLDAARNGEDVAFRTRFSQTHDLVQVMRGLASTPYANHPVDFRLAALQRRGHGDIWHMDQVLAFSTDECSPLVINGEDIGGNHGHPCAVRVHVPGHGMDCRDVGSCWQDEAGMGWTLLRVQSADCLLLLSDNIGPSVTAYAFADHVKGSLRCVGNGLHAEPLHPQGQQGGVQMTPAIRHVRREAVCLRDGVWQEIGGFEKDCEAAEIRETYEIVNPATVAAALREARPLQGYAQQPSLAVGEAMAVHRMIYRIETDGTILCDFEHELLQDVQMTCFLGIMHQEKCDVYGGGLWRYIPGLRPFEDKGRLVDFSRPYRTAADTMPSWRALTPDLWQDPSRPPDRQLDFIRRGDGSSAVGFASGFLPLYDGERACRAANLTDAGMLAPSCKTYPTFAGGVKCRRNFPKLHGVAYKKYFLPSCEGCSVTTVRHDGVTWVFMDFYSDKPETALYPLSADQEVTLVEATIPWRRTESGIAAQGTKGCAVFRLTDPSVGG